MKSALTRHGLHYADAGDARAISAGGNASFALSVPAGFGDAVVYDVAANFPGNSSSFLERGTNGPFGIRLPRCCR